MKKSKNPNGRLWRGDYVWPGDRTPAQREFFCAIRRSAPEVLESLRNAILPAFKRIISENRSGEAWIFTQLYPLLWNWAQDHHLVTGERFIRPSETCCHLKELEVAERIKAFDDEAPEKTFFFSWAWIAIVATLAEWCDDSAKLQNLDWELPFRCYPIGTGRDMLQLGTLDDNFLLEDLFNPPKSAAESVPFTFSCPGWDPFQEPRAKARHRILQQFELDLDRQLKQVESLVSAFHAEKAPAKMTSAHFDWLVQYQVKGWTYTAIAESDSNEPDKQTVWDGAVDAAEKVIGRRWKEWLRRSKIGRPKKG
jgi:hypothetical protein